MRFIKYANIPLLLVFILLSTMLPDRIAAQGLYQNWGVSYGGYLFSTDSTGGNITGRHTFNYSNPGANPAGGSLVPFNGKLYGLYSGIEQGPQSGIYEFDPAANIYTQKQVLEGNKGDGAVGSLLFYNNELYGTTIGGGINNAGVIFKYDPVANVYTKLFDMVDSTGNSPNGSLVLYNNKMYGLTSYGGRDQKGVIFEFDPGTNNYSKIAEIDSSGGWYPFGSLLVYNNKFYGTCSEGGTPFVSVGSIFEFDPGTRVFTNTYNLSEASGNYPYGSLTEYGGKLWGQTDGGGINGVGVIFQYDPLNGNYTKMYDFSTAVGYHPSGDLVVMGDKMYGLSDGGLNGAGIVFEYDPNTNAVIKLADLSFFKGKDPGGNLLFFNNKFYGFTYHGGSADAGVIFEFDPATSVYTKKIDFNASEAFSPVGSLSYFNKNLYGLTSEGGPLGSGVIFKYNLSTNQTSIEQNFDTINGRYPLGDLLLYNNKFYGLTLSGGLYNRGVLYSYDPVGKIYNKLFDFDSTQGGNPLDLLFINYSYSPLLLYNNKIYGTTHAGGAKNAGVLFEFDPANNQYQKKIDFDSVTVAQPTGGLAVFGNKFYGASIHGGSTNNGVLFNYDPSANTYNKVYDFSNSNYLNEQTGLLSFNNKLYGVSGYNGANQGGYLFEFDPIAASFVNKRDFDSATGWEPWSGLMLKNNLFYGRTFSGGAYNAGVVYEYNPNTNTYLKKGDFDGLTNGGDNDNGNLITVPAQTADGIIGTCSSLPALNIAIPKNNQWQGITDQYGNAIAEINPNGNDLGTINASIYVQNNPVRKTGGLNYLNRSITISVQNQPAAGHPVDLRLYIKKSELDDIINTPGSGISSVNDLAVYKSESPCSNTIATDLVKLTTSGSGWGTDYVLSTQVNSFSTFHFSTGATPLPISLIDFTVTQKTKFSNQLSWKTSSELNSNYFSIERSANGIDYAPIGKAAASGFSNLPIQYDFVDANAIGATLYYRLKMVDKDAAFKYSKVVRINNDQAFISITPNPAQNTISISGVANIKQIEIVDPNGQVMRQFTMNPGNVYDVSDLRAGLYVMRLIGDNETIIKKFVKL